MSVINTNISAMLQNLRGSQASLQTSMERLSSGLRINSAKDDAAGQAIANRMTAQIRGLSQAQRNANDGISVAQTAEGALNQVNDNVQHIRELAVQAANGTNNRQDLDSIQNEIDQRLSEIDRIFEQTDFNGIKVLGSGAGPLSIQVGANDGETISINLEAINKQTLGLSDFRVLGTERPTHAGLTTSGASGEVIALNGLDLAVGTAGSATLAEGATLAFVMPSANASANPLSSAPGANNLVETQDGSMYYRHGSGASAEFYAVAFALESGFDGSSTGNTNVSVSFKGGAEAKPLDAGVLGITDVAGEAKPATTGPLAALDDALSTIDGLRSNLGAVQNRFESTIQTLANSEINLSAARSRIQDTDYAKEVANMIKQQILQQAGMSVLAQANQIPQNVLSLLG